MCGCLLEELLCVCVSHQPIAAMVGGGVETVRCRLGCRPEGKQPSRERQMVVVWVGMIKAHAADARDNGC